MLEYQNLFTRVQIRTAPEPGLPIENGDNRVGTGCVLRTRRQVR